MADIRSATAEIRRGKKKKKEERKKNKRQDENLYGLPYYIGRPKKQLKTVVNSIKSDRIFNMHKNN